MRYYGGMVENVSAVEVAKWAVLVFLAGFIGFFGKALGRKILAVFQRGKGGAAQSPSVPAGSVSSPGEDRVQNDDAPAKGVQKAMKKALKARSKAAKKAGGD